MEQAVIAMQTQADLFPLIRSGGLFLTIVGVTILVGALQFRWRNQLLGAGAALATAATIATAAQLAGAPTGFQVGSLILAVSLEIVALIWAVRRFSPRGERAVTIAVLAVVAGHFIFMAPAFGLLIVLLGTLALCNALAGARFQSYALRSLWAVDGLLKLGVGAAMFATS